MRVIRLLVYEGEESWVSNVLSESIKGKKMIPGDKRGKPRSITAITLGSVPDDLCMFIDENMEKEGESTDG